MPWSVKSFSEINIFNFLIHITVSRIYKCLVQRIESAKLFFSTESVANTFFSFVVYLLRHICT